MEKLLTTLEVEIKDTKKIKTIYEYNVNVGRWEDAGVNLSAERDYHCSVILQEHLYVLGGAGRDYRDISTVEKFEIGKWGFMEAASSAPDLSVARRSHACAVIEDGGVEKIIVAGGYFRKHSKVDSVEVWWPGKNDAWVQVGTLPQWRFAFTLTALPQLLVISGGEDKSGRSLNSTLTSSNNGNFWMAGPELSSARSYHSAVIVEQQDEWC